MTFRGWLLDLYLNQEEGLTLWFIGEDDRRVCFRQAFPPVSMLLVPMSSCARSGSR